MTGFGESQIEEDGHAYHVEVRSVNHRYLKTAIRLPEDLVFLELELEQLVRRHVSRGSLSVRVYVRDLSAAAAHEINVAAIQQYVARLRAVMERGSHFGIDLATLAMLPGVCQPPELSRPQRERIWQIVGRLTEEALLRMIEMRRAEGQALAGDLRNHCERIRQHVQAIRGLAPRVVADYRDRLIARVNQLIAGSNVTLAEADVLREVAIYADRSDISEELSRIASHLDQFVASIASPEPVGRRLEFIAQELMREANTIGSKAGDPDISGHTIEIKSAIDRLKEQVQNVE